MKRNFGTSNLRVGVVNVVLKYLVSEGCSSSIRFHVNVCMNYFGYNPHL